MNEIKELVFLNKDVAMTTSLKIAEVFEKEHKHILEAIKNLDCSEEFNRSNFRLVNYTDAKGEKRPAYNLTRDGFVFLAMGFTGKKAAQFKEAYIKAFNKMESHILNELKNQQIKDNKKAMLDAVGTGHWISNRLQAYSISKDDLALFYFYRLNWMTQKEIMRAFNFSLTQVQVMEQILEKEGHRIPDIYIQKRKNWLRQLKFYNTIEPSKKIQFSYFEKY